MSDVMHWISRYWGILVVLAGIVFWAGRLEMKVTGLDEKIVGLHDKIVGLDGRVANLEERVANLEERVASLEERVASLEEKVESLDEKVDLILQILLDGDYSQEASKIAQQLGAAD